MVNDYRHKRLESSVYKRFIQMQQGEIKDPLLTELFITTVEATPDMKKVIIYFKAEDKIYAERVRKSYEKAKGFLRKELFKEIKMRYVPYIYLKPDFKDVSIKKIEELLNND